LRLQLLEKVCFLFDILDIYKDHAHIYFPHGCIFCVVTQEQLDRAKQATKSAVLMNLESRVCISNHYLNPLCLSFVSCCILDTLFSSLQVVASEDIGRQILTYGERYGCTSIGNIATKVTSHGS
jgi:hypothetical protein